MHRWPSYSTRAATRWRSRTPRDPARDCCQLGLCGLQPFCHRRAGASAARPATRRSPRSIGSGCWRGLAGSGQMSALWQDLRSLGLASVLLRCAVEMGKLGWRSSCRAVPVWLTLRSGRRPRFRGDPMAYSSARITGPRAAAAPGVHRLSVAAAGLRPGRVRPGLSRRSGCVQLGRPRCGRWRQRVRRAL